MKVKCDKADDCPALFCKHKDSHYRTIQCGKACPRVAEARCVPVEEKP